MLNQSFCCCNQLWRGTGHFVQALVYWPLFGLCVTVLHISCVLIGCDCIRSSSIRSSVDDLMMRTKLGRDFSDISISETDGGIILDRLPHSFASVRVRSFNYQMQMEELLCKQRVCGCWKRANRQVVQQPYALGRSEKLQVNRLVWHEGMLTGSRLFPWRCLGFVLRSWLIFTPAFTAFDSIKD